MARARLALEDLDGGELERHAYLVGEGDDLLAARGEGVLVELHGDLRVGRRKGALSQQRLAGGSESVRGAGFASSETRAPDGCSRSAYVISTHAGDAANAA